MTPSTVPPEIIAIIVSKLRESKYSLSAISLAWPQTLPIVRELRFKDIKISTSSSMMILKDLIDGAPEISTVIRKLTFMCESTQILHMASSAVHLEELWLDGIRDWTSGFLAILRAFTHLTSITLAELSVSCLSNLFEILLSLPKLTTLSLIWLDIKELSDVARRLWPDTTDLRNTAVTCTPWDFQDFEAPKPLSLISHLTLLVSDVGNLVFLDLICSPKSPFPNLQDISIEFGPIKMCRPHRLPALLGRYHTSLRVLGMDNLENVPELTLPPNMEHFGCVVNKAWVARFCQIVSSSCSTLKNVTMKLPASRSISPRDVEELDQILAGMNLDGWILVICTFLDLRDVDHDVLRGYFPRCLKRCDDGEWVGGINLVHQ